MHVKLTDAEMENWTLRHWKHWINTNTLSSKSFSIFKARSHTKHDRYEYNY